MNETQSNELLEIQKAQLEIQKQRLQIEQEQRKFTILQRERTMSEESKKKTFSSTMAATCILGTAVAIHFSDLNTNEVLQHELNSIYSRKELKQYFQDLGPLITLLGAGSGVFIARAFKHSKKYKDAMHQFEDMNASLNNMEVEENANTR